MKKILFLILLLIPLTVQAYNIDNLNIKWQIEKTNKEYSELYRASSYEMNNNYIFYSEEKFMSMNKLTGETKEIDAPRIHLKSNDIIIGLNDDNNELMYYVYDENLNIIKEENLGDMEVVHFNPYDENYYLLVGNEVSNDMSITKLFFIDKEGNIKHTYEKQLKNPLKMKINYDLKTDKILMDENSNIFYIEDFQIKPRYTNSDGSYMYQENTKLSKISSTGEVIEELELPQGQFADIAKMGDYYYVASEIYEINNPKEILINLVIYQIDEDLNVIKTTTTNNTEPVSLNNNYNESDGAWLNDFYEKDGHIYCKYYYGDYKTKYYEIDENLNLISRSNNPYFNYYVSRYSTSLNDDMYLPLTKRPSYDIERGLKYRLEEEYPEFEDFELRMDNDGNIFAIVNLEKIVTITGGKETYYKGILKAYDENLNEKYSLELFDWILYRRTTNSSMIDYFYPECEIYYVDEYILLTHNDSHKNHILILDKQGNVLRDLSEDLVDFDDLEIYTIKVTDKGILFYLVTYMPSVQGAFKNLDDESQNTSVLGVYDFLSNKPSRMVWLYYTDIFDIQTKITGEGAITATETEAKEGTEIRFTVTPKKGYVLSAVKVTDSKGNVLSFTDYTFTMPSANVTIEATFVLAATNNPDTGDIAIIAIIVLAILSSIILITQKKKLDFLK